MKSIMITMIILVLFNLTIVTKSIKEYSDDYTKKISSASNFEKAIEECLTDFNKEITTSLSEIHDDEELFVPEECLKEALVKNLLEQKESIDAEQKLQHPCTKDLLSSRGPKKRESHLPHLTPLTTTGRINPNALQTPFLVPTLERQYPHRLSNSGSSIEDFDPNRPKPKALPAIPNATTTLAQTIHNQKMVSFFERRSSLEHKLLEAIIAKDNASMKKLIEIDRANPNAPLSESGLDALGAAIAHNNLDAVVYLTQEGSSRVQSTIAHVKRAEKQLELLESCQNDVLQGRPDLRVDEAGLTLEQAFDFRVNQMRLILVNVWTAHPNNPIERINAQIIQESRAQAAAAQSTK